MKNTDYDINHLRVRWVMELVLLGILAMRVGSSGHASNRDQSRSRVPTRTHATVYGLQAFATGMVRTLAATGHLEVRGKENIPANESSILSFNHLGFGESVLINTLVRHATGRGSGVFAASGQLGGTGPISKELRAAFKQMHWISVDTENRGNNNAAIQQAMRLLDEGIPLAIAIEGENRPLFRLEPKDGTTPGVVSLSGESDLPDMFDSVALSVLSDDFIFSKHHPTLKHGVSTISRRKKVPVINVTIMNLDSYAAAFARFFASFSKSGAQNSRFARAAIREGIRLRDLRDKDLYGPITVSFGEPIYPYEEGYSRKRSLLYLEQIVEAMRALRD